MHSDEWILRQCNPNINGKNARAQLFLLDGKVWRGYRPGMNGMLTPDQIVEAAKRNGMTPQQLCERAGVAYTVLWRWRTNRGDIKLASYRALVAASNVAAGEPA